MRKVFILVAGLLCVLNALSAEYVKTVHGSWVLEEYGVSVEAEASLDDSLQFDVIYDFTGDALKPFIEDFSIVFLDAGGYKASAYLRLRGSETEETAEGVRRKASYEISNLDSYSPHLALEFPYCVDSLRIILPRQLVEAYQSQKSPRMDYIEYGNSIPEEIRGIWDFMGSTMEITADDVSIPESEALCRLLSVSGINSVRFSVADVYLTICLWADRNEFLFVIKPEGDYLNVYFDGEYYRAERVECV